MSFERCQAAISNAAGRALSPEENKLVRRRTAAILRELRANQQNGLDPEQGLRSTLAQEAAQLQVQKALQKRNALLNRRARVELDQYIRNTWGDDPGSGLRAAVSGLNTPRFGARNSVAAQVSNTRNGRVGAFLSELEENDLLDVMRTGEFDLEIRQVARALDRGEDLARFNPAAVEATRTIRKHTDAMRRDLNSAGGWTAHREGWIAPQTHDPFRIAKGGRERDLKSRSLEAKERWKASIRELWDENQSMKSVLPGDRDSALNSLYEQFASGKHLVFGADGSSKVAGVGFANLAKRAARQREIVFKSPEAEQEYFRRYGFGESLYETLVDFMDRSGRDLALLRRLGPNPTDNIDKVFRDLEDDLAKQNRSAELDRLRSEHEFISKRVLPTLTGAANVSDNIAVAAASEGARNIFRMADLGGMFVASFNDVNNAAARLAFTGGRSASDYFKATAAIAEELFTNIGRGTAKDAASLAVENRVLLDGLHLPPSTGWSDIETPGKIARATRMAFRYFGANWWVNRLRVASTVASTTRYGMHRDVPYTSLPEGMRAAFSEYGLAERDWDIIRNHAPLQDYRGTPALTTGGILEIPDVALFGHPDVVAIKEPTPEKLARKAKEIREKIADSYATLIADVADGAITAPTALTRAITTGGGQRGSLGGELSRHFWLYRTYSLAYMERHLGQVLHGYHPDRVGTAQAIARMFTDPKQGQLGAMAGLIGGGLFYGLLSVSVADFLTQGKFRPPPETPEEAATIMSAAFARSGAIGLYNDLFSQHITERTDFASFAAGLLGPSAGRAVDAGDLTLKAVTQNWDDGETRDAWRLAYQTIPGRNLFYTRWLTDNLIYHNVAEALRPGHKADLEAFQTEELGYEFLTPPTDPLAPFGE